MSDVYIQGLIVEAADWLIAIDGAGYNADRGAEQVAGIVHKLSESDVRALRRALFWFIDAAKTWQPPDTTA